METAIRPHGFHVLCLYQALSLRICCIFVNSQCDFSRPDQPCVSFLFPFSSYPFSLVLSSPKEYTVAWFSRSLCLSIQRGEAAPCHPIASLPVSL